MRAVRHVALLLTVLLPMLASTMACSLTNGSLSQAERACCQQMQGKCYGSSMPSEASSCCQSHAITPDMWSTAMQTQSTNVQLHLAALAGMSSAILMPRTAAVSAIGQWPGKSLPQSPPSAVSILRI